MTDNADTRVGLDFCVDMGLEWFAPLTGLDVISKDCRLGLHRQLSSDCQPGGLYNSHSGSPCRVGDAKDAYSSSYHRTVRPSIPVVWYKSS
jgi:hypothetical protein